VDLFFSSLLSDLLPFEVPAEQDIVGRIEGILAYPSELPVAEKGNPNLGWDL